MNKIAPVIAASLVLSLALAGCTSAKPADTGKTPDSAPVASTAPAPQPDEAADAPESEFGDPVTNSRGNLVKELGQLAGTSSLASDVVTSRFAVTDIVLDHECTSEYADAPANGHYLGIHLNVETTPELADEEFPSVIFTAYDWQAYDADGKRLNDPVGNSWSCLDPADQLPMEIGPGQSVSGWIVLDVAAPTGSVVLAPLGSTGWEWSY